MINKLLQSVIFLLAIGCCQPSMAQELDEDVEGLFVHRVLPTLQEKCFSCHGNDAEDLRGEFDMRTRAGMLKGGESGEPSLVPGQAEQSSLYLAVTREDSLWSAMPPKENDRLTVEQMAALQKWVDAGAPWPSESRIEELRAEPGRWGDTNGVSVATSGGLSDLWTNRKYDPEDLWAYQPLQRSANTSSSIDELIDKRLASVGLEPAEMVDRRTLLRRATFDLLGLPPTPEEIDAFVNDPQSDQVAFAKVIERLLASPHYGEQWGRHWLDIARYADSSGYANDYERGPAWRYRDYVVRAFNEDKPYDTFVREQLAGDEWDPDDPEKLVATGFLRMGAWELTGMEVPKVARQRFLDDVTDAVGQVFLAHMLQCARCHDHKFDPVPTRDYYSMQAIFATTQMADRNVSYLPTENTAGFEEVKYLDLRRDFYEGALDALRAKQTVEACRQWYRDEGKDPQLFEDTLLKLQAPNKTKGAGAGEIGVSQIRNRMAKDGVPPDLIPPRHVGFNSQDFGMERISRKGLQRLNWRRDRYQPIAMSVYNGKTPSFKSVQSPLRLPEDPLAHGTLEETSILTGGDPFSPSQAVAPGVLSAVDIAIDPLPTTYDARRTELAEWITHPDNPLTARVMVNRIWQWHFGKPLAGNPNNFGATGKKPTHPELLDYLAGYFVENGWSVKNLHRLIMSSRAYRRATQYADPKLLDQKDPNRELWAVFLPRRLDAEELWDAMLAVSGELNTELGGIPVRPEMNLEAALQPRMVMGTFAEAWQPSPLPDQRHRRSLYAQRVRGHRDPFLEVFNAPNADLSCEAREASTVTPQVFALFNSEMSFNRAIAMAHRVLTSTSTPREATELAIKLAYGRSATAAELDKCLAHWKQMTQRHEKLVFQPVEYPREVIREAVEENTGVRFQFVEPLEIYDDFVPDLGPSQVDARTRGFAELCLVLFNSNEFTYVY